MKKFYYIFVLIGFLFYVNNVYAYQSYNIGDMITYNGDDYYVIEKSDEEKNYVTLLKDKFLTSSEIEKYKGDIAEYGMYGKMGLYSAKDDSTMAKNYDDTKIKVVVDNWAELEFGNDLVNVDGYKSRLLNLADISNLGFSSDSNCSEAIISFHYKAKNNIDWSVTTKCDSSGNNCYYYYTFDNKNYKSCEADPVADQNGDIRICSDVYGDTTILNFLEVTDKTTNCIAQNSNLQSYTTNKEYRWLISDSQNFWTMVKQTISGENWIYHYKGSSNEIYYSTGNSASALNVRPVVNIKKSAIGNQQNYSIGDKITYKNEDYNVIYNTDSLQDYVTVLKYRPLSQIQIDIALNNDIDGKTQYFATSTCNGERMFITGCYNSFTSSNIQTILNNWYNDKVKAYDQFSIDDVKFRLLTLDELMDNFGYVRGNNGTASVIMKTDDTPEWIYDKSLSYWITGGEDDQKLNGAVTDIVDFIPVYSYSRIRPVIYLQKCTIGDKSCNPLACKEGSKPVYDKKVKYVGLYNVGDIIEVSGEKYYVLKESSIQSKFVTLLKIDPLTAEQVNKYGDSKYESENGEVPYNNDCYISYNGLNHYNSYDSTDYEKKCVGPYDNFSISKIVDNWANDVYGEDNLFEVDGYKSRMLTLDELSDALFYVERSERVYDVNWGWYTTTLNGPSLKTPEEISKSEYSSWILKEDYDGWSWSVKTYGAGDMKSLWAEQLSYVRPVINLDKCEIDGGCEYEDVIVGCEDEEGNFIPISKNGEEQVVTVPSTLSSISKIVFIISLFLIITGLGILTFNYYRAKKYTKK